MARYLRAGRVLTSALGGPFHSEPENLDPPLGQYDEFGHFTLAMRNRVEVMGP